MEEERFNYSTNDATRFVDELKDRVHELYDENKRLNNIIKNQQEDIEEYNDKLNEVVKERNKYLHIINEIEKYINEEYIYDEVGMKIFDASELQDKLQELKGVDKEC